mmetsp:Transcript_9984/g.18168  ORF Transcript_9984/g.18168 Transcript_9984/m.18168 type:complete len:335 (-) Transcript_9984:168-1172(-)
MMRSRPLRGSAGVVAFIAAGILVVCGVCSVGHRAGDLRSSSQMATRVGNVGRVGIEGQGVMMQQRTRGMMPLLSRSMPASMSSIQRGMFVRAAKEDIQSHADQVLESNKILIAPAMATSDCANFGPEIDKAMAGGADVIHVNIMDAHFTKKMTFGPMFIKSLRKYGITAPFDVQLTATDIVDHLISEFADAGANYITFHPEGSLHVDRSLSLIKEKGLKCGLVLDPSTPVSVLEYVMDKVDIILLMSINPGFPNQKFQESIFEKAKTVSAMIKDSGRKIRLEIDGGVGVGTIKKLSECGVDMFVVGRGVFHADDYGEAIKNLRSLAEEGIAAPA